MELGATIQQARKEKKLTQEQLAQKAAVPYTTLTKIESGAIKNPSAQVVSKLARALGVSLDSLLTPQVFHGPGSVQQIFHDVLSSMNTRGEFMCISGLEEGRYLEQEPQAVKDFVEELGRRGISQKLICCEGDTNFLAGDHLEYRWIPKKHFYSVPMYVYGDKVAFLLWGPPQQVVILDSPVLAEAYRRQFFFLWENATPVPKSARGRSAGSKRK